VPVRTSDHGTNACLTFVQYDGTLEAHISVGLVVQHSESIDIFGITLRCLQFFAPHFKYNFEKYNVGTRKATRGGMNEN